MCPKKIGGNQISCGAHRSLWKSFRPGWARPGLVDDNAESGEFLTVFDDEGNKFQAA